MRELTHLYMGKPAKYWAELESRMAEREIEFKWLRGEYVRIRQRCDDLVAICARHDVPESELLEEGE